MFHMPLTILNITLKIVMNDMNNHNFEHNQKIAVSRNIFQVLPIITLYLIQHFQGLQAENSATESITVLFLK